MNASVISSPVFAAGSSSYMLPPVDTDDIFITLSSMSKRTYVFEFPPSLSSVMIDARSSAARISAAFAKTSHVCSVGRMRI